MQWLAIQCSDQAGNEPCGLCGQALLAHSGPGLCLRENGQLVCRDCGRREAPHLLALLDLAQAAERIGKVSRHVLVPPMESLLNLARAAEDYVNSNVKRLEIAA